MLRETRHYDPKLVAMLITRVWYTKEIWPCEWPGWRMPRRRRCELELKGLNMRADEGQEIVLTLHDYAEPYQEEQEKNKQLSEEVEALRAQLAAMRGDRPRPPRPPLN